MSKIVGLAFVLLNAFVFPTWGLTKTSDTKFSIQYCFKTTCFVARSQRGFISIFDQSISAQNAVVSIHQNQSIKTFTCESIRYNVKAQFLICDNQDVGEKTLTIDYRFIIKEYLAVNI